jgi:hypothetical protein
MTRAERAAVIERLRRANEAAIERQRELLARYEETQRQFNLVSELYFDALAAPWRAFAEELRR